MKTLEQNAEVGVIIARFQTPYLHEGHLEILNQVITTHPRVIVFLGVSPLRCTKNNPLLYPVREAMLKEQFPDIEVYPLEDVGDNDVWSKMLDKNISKIIGPNLKVVLYGSRDSFVKTYSGKYTAIELVPTKIVSASVIRKQIGIKAKNTIDFRAGIIHAVENQFPSIKATVDMAIVNFDTNELLLAQKPNETLWRFPGGFTDPTQDFSAEDAAIRESLEETSLHVTVESYMGSSLVTDWRYKLETDKIMTFFYLMKYNGGTPGAADDIAHVKWFKFGEIAETDIRNGHRPLIRMLDKHFNGEILKKA